MTLRKIAEKHKRYPPQALVVWANKDIAFLINGWVEERAKRREAEWLRFHSVTQRSVYERGKLIANPHYNWTDENWHTQALRELGLDKVWPPQTHSSDCALTLNARHDCSCGR